MAFPAAILHEWTNSGRSTLAGGIDASQTTLTLATGTGGRFPSGHFRARIWNETDWPDNPDDDPDSELIHVTTRTSETCDPITRGVEGTVAAAHNTPGKTYAIALVASKAFRDDLEQRLQLARRVVITTPGSGTIPVPQGATHALITAVGAGAGGSGGGSGGQGSAGTGGMGGGGGPGGAAGETVRRYPLPVTPGEDLSYAVGAKGPGGPGGAAVGAAANANGNTGSPGTAGGSTSVTGAGGTVTAQGGQPGPGGERGYGLTGNFQDNAQAAPTQHATSLAFPATGGASAAQNSGSNGGAGGNGAVAEVERGTLTAPTGTAGSSGGAGGRPSATDATDATGYGTGGPGGGGSGGSNNGGSVGKGGDGGDGTDGYLCVEFVG